MATKDQLNWWTEERVAELTARWANHETFAQICVALGATSRSAVIGKAHRLKLMRPESYVKASRNTNGPMGVRRRVRSRRVNGGIKMIEDKPPIFAEPKLFIELRDVDCRWPLAGKPGPDLPCCGAPAIGGKPYCAAHCRIAYNPPSRPRL